MFHTPRKQRAMVNTRSTAKKNKELHGEMSKGPEGMETAVEEGSRLPNTTSDCDEQRKDIKLQPPSMSKSRSKSTSSSVLARRKRLELEAAEAKAKIQMEIIDKKLAADLAELENEEYSSQSEGKEEEDHTQVAVEKWLDRSHRELEAEAAQPQDTNLGDHDLPLPSLAQQATAPGGTDGTISKLQPMTQEYHREIITFSVKVKNYVAAVLAIGQDEYLKGTNLLSIILSKLPTVLISKWADYSYPIISSGNKPKLMILSEFLSQEAIKISKTSVSLIYNPSDYKRKQSDYKTQTVLVQNSSDSNVGDDKCRFCKINKHKIIDCKKFRKALRKDRWQYIKRNGLCYKCLVSRHNRDSCSAPVCDTDNCGQPHHQLLHYPNGRGNQQSEPTVAAAPGAPAPASAPRSTEAVAFINEESYSQVLLKTVPIKIHGPNGTVNTVALLDDGSTVTIASDVLMVKLGIRGRKQTLKVRGAWDSSELMYDSEIVDLSVSNCDGTMFTLQARTTKGLNLPTQFISLDKLKCGDAINNIKHKLCYGQCKPEILIGQDNYDLLLPLEVIKGKPTEPYLTRTPLGWCLHGRASLNVNVKCRSKHSTLFLTATDESQIENECTMNDLHEEVRRSFSIEAMGVTGKPRLNSEDERAIAHLERTSILKDGSAIDGDMMRRAERLLIMHSQRQTFAEDLENLKQKKPLDRKSKLLTLTPVIDEYGVLRVGSRIEQAPGISPETKYPVILDGRSHVAQLIVRHHHEPCMLEPELRSPEVSAK
ncbi:hypothetical protein SFRURICE_007318 [Spodoptera frugiperda]|nr:hypothetical protein SFRURICE_007318 [Spodoptera frugiperda]